MMLYQRDQRDVVPSEIFQHSAHFVRCIVCERNGGGKWTNLEQTEKLPCQENVTERKAMGWCGNGGKGNLLPMEGLGWPVSPPQLAVSFNVYKIPGRYPRV